MLHKFIKPWVLIAILFLIVPNIFGQDELSVLVERDIVCGADRSDVYLDQLLGLQVGLVGNKSSRVKDQHLVDYLLEQGVHVNAIFCPEHGFRSDSEAGAHIENHTDPISGLPVVSLYGKNKKPAEKDLSDLDLLLFDIQDVGARFYTYISTLHYVMEAAAEHSIRVMILDRPNPNGFYIDGPIREPGFESFVGMHPVPVVHGMTIGEYALMINGEGWLKNGVQCELEIIPCLNYDHLTAYHLPIPPSPNLPNQISVYLYPSLCFFEGSIISVGRGTHVPFQVFGHPELKGPFHFRPLPIAGASLHPKWENLLCRGFDMRDKGIKEIFTEPCLKIEWVIKAYELLGKPDDFFTGYFDTLAGTDQIRLGIIGGLGADEIREEWEEELADFHQTRKRYLLYKDF